MTRDYPIWIKEQDFRIEQRNILPAVAAIHALLSGPKKAFVGITGSFEFDPVNAGWGPGVAQEAIGELFERFWWSLAVDHRGVCGIESDRIRHDLAYALFSTVAPFVEQGSFIEFHDEDGDHYQFMFRDKTCTESQAEVVWRSDADHARQIKEAS